MNPVNCKRGKSERQFGEDNWLPVTGMASPGGQFYLTQEDYERARRDVTRRLGSLSDRYCGVLVNGTFAEQGTTLITINYHFMCTRDTRGVFKRSESKFLSAPRHILGNTRLSIKSLGDEVTRPVERAPLARCFLFPNICSTNLRNSEPASPAHLSCLSKFILA